LEQLDIYIYITIVLTKYKIISLYNRGRRGRDRMVV